MHMKKPLSIVVLLFAAFMCIAASLKLEWDKPEGWESLAGYKLEVRAHSPTNITSLSITNGASTNFTLTNITAGHGYTFSIRSEGTNGLVSEPSDDLVVVVPSAPLRLRVALQGGLSLLGPWVDQGGVEIVVNPTNGTQFYRASLLVTRFE